MARLSTNQHRYENDEDGVRWYQPPEVVIELTDLDIETLAAGKPVVQNGLTVKPYEVSHLRWEVPA